MTEKICKMEDGKNCMYNFEGLCKYNDKCEHQQTPLTIEERLANVEAILIHKFGTLDLEVIKEKDARFYKECNEKLEKINKDLDEMGEKQKENEIAWRELEASRKSLDELKKELGYDT